MSEKKKKQHYVPQGYLEAWAIPGTHQIYVYDKQLNSSRKSNITDVASENYFHDIDFTDILSETDLKKIGLEGSDPAKLDDKQYIENFFSNQIEGNYKTHLRNIIDKLQKMTPWEVINCFFISERDKVDFSYHLAYQYIRVKAVRNSMMDSMDCLNQVLTDLGASTEVIEKYSFPKSHLPYIHGQMILNMKEIEELAESFFTLTWILYINRTEQPFFTSDSPIGTEAHVSDPIVSMSGLQCKGVEAFFPLSPKLMLLMFDGDYHEFCQGYDRRIFELDNSEVVKYCNSRCMLFSERCVFSNNSDFSISEEMLEKNPNIFNQPHTVIKWGGKTYSPRKKHSGK